MSDDFQELAAQINGAVAGAMTHEDAKQKLISVGCDEGTAEALAACHMGTFKGDVIE